MRPRRGVSPRWPLWSNELSPKSAKAHLLLKPLTKGTSLSHFGTGTTVV
jgi:hypothetical protein